MEWPRSLETAGALIRLLVRNTDLLYWLLPRRLRGGYRSPWLAKRGLA